MTGYEKQRRRIFNHKGAIEPKVRGEEGREKMPLYSFPFSLSPSRSIFLLLR
jgi:hypothetical protein